MRVSRASMRRVSPIGIDLSPAEVRLVQLEGTPGSVRSVRCAIVPRLAEPNASRTLLPEEAGYIAEVVERRGFEGNLVSLCAPHAACTSHVVDLPPRASNAPIEAIARAEIGRARRSAPTGFELAAWYLPQRGRSEQGVAVVCERGPLDEQLDSLESVGLWPVAVDIEELALVRAALPQIGSENDAIHAVLRVGWNASLGVLVLGGSVVYTRRIEFGASAMVTRLVDRLGLSWSEAGRILDTSVSVGSSEAGMERAAHLGWSQLGEHLGAEVDTAVTYVSHAHRAAPIGRVVVAGYGAARAELTGGLETALGMPVEPCLWWGDAAGPGSLDHGARLAVAGALAARWDE